MNKSSKVLIGIVILAVISVSAYAIYKNQQISAPKKIKIGIITALTGDFAFYGESSRAGAELAKKELEAQGIKIDLLFEDGQFDPKLALNAAQKLVNVDGADAIYSEFNPAAIAVSSFLKGKTILHIYDAAPVSPLEGNPLTYKTYIDFQAGCGDVAKLLRVQGIERAGMLKVNTEFGDLCLKGIKDVFHDAIFVEGYNLGTTDFRSALIKLKQNQIQVLFNIAPPSETIASKKELDALKMIIPFVGESSTFSPDVIKQNSSILNGVIVFGLPPASDEFIQRLNQEFPNKKIGFYQAAALAYVHIKQIGNAITKCGHNVACLQGAIDSSKVEPVAGFQGFKEHIAVFRVPLQKFSNGKFVNISE